MKGFFGSRRYSQICLLKLVEAIFFENRPLAKLALFRIDLSEKQANAVLDLRLYQLTSLEHEKIAAEHAELIRKIDYFKAVFTSEEIMNRSRDYIEFQNLKQ